MQRNTGLTESITVEYGFLDSTLDDVNQLKNNYKEYAEAVIRAVLQYIGLGYNDNTYTVKSGDTLYGIASKYNISVNELKETNNLSSNVLNIGQKLKIPSKELPQELEGYETYIVQKGDSLYSIAKKFNITVDDIKRVNNLSGNLLSINQKLLIPTGSVIIDEVDTNYIVKNGDTLFSIASKYNVSVNKLKEVNNLTSNLLSIGQILKIPTEEIEIIDNNDYITYVVQKGDTLYSISKKYDITQSELMDYNGLTNNILSIGQILKIPSKTETIRYTVKLGDSLYSIARKFNTTVDDIKQKNNLTSNLLSIGQILII